MTGSASIACLSSITLPQYRLTISLTLGSDQHKFVSADHCRTVLLPKSVHLANCTFLFSFYYSHSLTRFPPMVVGFSLQLGRDSISIFFFFLFLSFSSSSSTYLQRRHIALRQDSLTHTERVVTRLPFAPESFISLLFSLFFFFFVSPDTTVVNNNITEAAAAEKAASYVFNFNFFFLQPKNNSPAAVSGVVCLSVSVHLFFFWLKWFGCSCFSLYLWWWCFLFSCRRWCHGQAR